MSEHSHIVPRLLSQLPGYGGFISKILVPQHYIKIHNMKKYFKKLHNSYYLLSAEITAIRAGFMELSAEPCSDLNQ